MATPDMSKMNLSPEEAKNMARLMKDPKFMEMFADYAKEISDPKNREEMETALKEAEKRGEKVPGFPEGKELLIPTAGFCAKTKHEGNSKKVFINICYSDKVKEASGKERSDKTGTEWDIPYSLAPPVKATDKGGAECDVHDFVVNTETYKLAVKDYRFKKFVVDTAVDAIQKQRHVKLSQDFILPRLKCKGLNSEPRMLTISKFPSPATTSNIATGATGKKMQPDSRHSSSFTPTGSTSKNSPPRASCDSGNQSAEENNEVDVKSMHKFSTFKSSAKLSSSCESNLEADSSSLPNLRSVPENSTLIPDFHESESRKPAQEVEPKFKLVYLNHLDMAQFWEDKANLKVCEDEVKAIVLHVHLPGVVELSDIKLDVAKSEVAVLVPGKFNLKVPLQHQVDPDQGQAKFDKEKLLYQLEVTLPVIKHQPRVEHDKETLMI
ncbi:unnamed protein product [Calypogeia fissa]